MGKTYPDKSSCAESQCPDYQRVKDGNRVCVAKGGKRGAFGELLCPRRFGT